MNNQKPATIEIYSLALLVVIFLSTSFAYGHTPYLMPSRFEPLEDGTITLDAAFAEQFFVPEVAFDNDSFSVAKPDGSTVKPDFIHKLKSRTVLEHTLNEDGTYRFSTGRRYGAIFTTYEQEGEVLSSRDPNFKLPNDAKLVEKFQAVTLAETYVSKGAPNNKALNARGTGIEIVPHNHPNELFVDDDFSFALLFNGRPVAGALVEVFQARYQFGSGKPDLKLHTAADGNAKIPLKEEGVYLIQIRHKTPASPDAPAPLYSNTYTLVIEVID